MVRRLSHSPGHGARVAIVFCSKKKPRWSCQLCCPCLLGTSEKNEVCSTATVNTGINRILIGKHSWKTPDFLQNSWKKDKLYYYYQLHCLNRSPCVCGSFAARFLGPETTKQVSDGVKVVLSSHHQLLGWLWPAQLSLRCSCFPLGTPWALCDVCSRVHPVLPAASPTAPRSLSCELIPAPPGFSPPAPSYQQCPPRG